jgi:hypothetical protein
MRRGAGAARSIGARGVNDLGAGAGRSTRADGA